MHTSLTGAELSELVAGVHDAAAKPFVDAMLHRVASSTTDQFRVVWLNDLDSARRTYSIRRGHLGERGVDVRGLDALLAALDSGPPRRTVGCIATDNDEAKLIGFCDADLRTLVGWVIVPKDLPPLGAPIR